MLVTKYEFASSLEFTHWAKKVTFIRNQRKPKRAFVE
jgi:hypothetical protein